MDHATAITRWSTADVPQAQRLDYFEAALAQAIFPIALNRADARTFDAELSHARLGAIDALRLRRAAVESEPADPSEDP